MIVAMRSGFSLQAMTHGVPPHLGQVSMSMEKTRLKRCIHAMGASGWPGFDASGSRLVQCQYDRKGGGLRRAGTQLFDVSAIFSAWDIRKGYYAGPPTCMGLTMMAGTLNEISKALSLYSCLA